jgi:hypothetical protein
MDQAVCPTTEVEIMSHIVGPDDGNFPPDAARAILRLRLDDRLTDRLNVLAEKNRHGTLSAAEQTEFDSYLRVGRLLNLLQAKARLSLPRHNDSK